MTRILTIIALLFATPMLAACEDANSERSNDERDREETVKAIVDLLEQADGEWKTGANSRNRCSEEAKAEIKC